MSGEKVYVTASLLQSRDAFDKRPLQPRAGTNPKRQEIDSAYCPTGNE
ncbi:hypothetical protein [Mesorhizobium sp.]|nr:hypothetical protein [Mesorhizobium sp.]